MSKPLILNPDFSIYVQNLDPQYSKHDAESYFSKFGHVVSLIYKRKQPNFPYYALVQYESKEEASEAIVKIKTSIFGNFTPVASMFKRKNETALVDSRSDFYDSIKIKIDQIYELGKKKASVKIQPNIKQPENFKCEQAEEAPVSQIPVSQILKLIQKKISENNPELNGKARRHLKKVETGSLSSLLNDANTFQLFLNYLKSQDS